MRLGLIQGGAQRRPVSDPQTQPRCNTAALFDNGDFDQNDALANLWGMSTEEMLDIGQGLQEHLGTMVRWEGTLELRTRTLAALVVGRHFQAQYVWGIQGVIGVERDVPRSTIDAIRDDHSEGIPPEDLQIIDFTRQLVRANRVDEALAQAVIKRLGADQYVQLTTCIGYYAMLAMTVNGVELEPNPYHEALKV